MELINDKTIIRNVHSNDLNTVRNKLFFFIVIIVIIYVRVCLRHSKYREDILLLKTLL